MKLMEMAQLKAVNVMNGLQSSRNVNLTWTTNHHGREQQCQSLNSFKMFTKYEEDSKTKKMDCTWIARIGQHLCISVLARHKIFFCGRLSLEMEKWVSHENLKHKKIQRWIQNSCNIKRKTILEKKKMIVLYLVGYTNYWSLEKLLVKSITF